MSFAVMRDAVAHAYGMKPWLLTSTRKQRNIVRARHTLMAMAREGLGWSYADIAKEFGGKKYNYDHTSVIHGCKRAGEQWSGWDAAAVRTYCEMMQQEGLGK